MIKKDIRKLSKLLRQQISESDKEKFEDLILIKFQKLQLSNCKNFLSYAPIIENNEYNPILIEDYFLMMNEGAQLYYPVVNKDDTMDAVLIKNETVFEKKAFGIYEPINSEKINPSLIDIIIVPLLAFDKMGYRVGYGKGFFDKFVQQCNPSVIKIGISFFDPIEIDDINQWDLTLNYCITPENIYKF